MLEQVLFKSRLNNLASISVSPGMQQAGQQLKATTSKLGQRLQQHMVKGNAAEQQSWQQARSPATEAAGAGGPFAAAAGESLRPMIYCGSCWCIRMPSVHCAQ